MLLVRHILEKYLRICYNCIVLSTSAIALYVHIPFCRRKCNYCSFISYENKESSIPDYILALQKELLYYTGSNTISSIYFGGGTPSLLSVKQLNDILQTIHTVFRVDDKSEISLEANPGTIDTNYLSAIRKAGFNRLSLGIQSLQDKELAILGRIHTTDEARAAIGFARNAGFDNLNLDLIYGLPGQTLAEWHDTLLATITLGAEHLSLYGLSLEQNTPLWQAIEEKSIPAPDPDLCADQYEMAEDILSSYDYQQYEISNWAKAGRECRHNLVYWQYRSYLGIGVGAHSFTGNRRFSNTPELDTYIPIFTNDLAPVYDVNEKINPQLQIAERIILGLRLNRGIIIAELNHQSGINIMEYYNKQIKELTTAGLLEYKNGILRLTRRGRPLSNEVFWRFLPD